MSRAGKPRITDINWKLECKRYFFMLIGCLCYAFALDLFLVPSGTVAGGVTGMATLIGATTGIGVGVVSVLLNLPILLLGLRSQGLVFILRCFLTTAVLGVCIDLFAFLPPLTDNPLMAALYGGVAQGVGIGCFCRYEVSSGGTELLARIVRPFFPGTSIAMVLAVLDGLVVVVGSVVLGDIENMLRAFIVIFTASKLSDLIITGLDHAKLCYIITDLPEQVAKTLLESSPRGVTRICGEGMYTKSAKNVLMTVIKRQQVAQLRQIIQQVDPNAFVILSEATEVLGNGFNKIAP